MDRGLGQKPHHRPRRQRFPRAALADKADDLAFVDGQVQPLERKGTVAAFGQGDAQVFDFQKRLFRCVGHFFCLGFSASFSPSPIRLKERTVSRIATPGMTEQYQSVRRTARPCPIILPQLA